MKKLRVVALFICFMLLTQNIAFAYTTGTNYNVKIRGSYEIGNNSGRTIDARLQPILANTIDSLYSMFLDEKASTPFTNITPVDSKGNRRGETYLNSISNGSKGILNYEYLVRASTIDYEIDPANVSADYNYKSDLSIYLQPSSKVESDDSFIKNIANQIKNSIPSSDRNNPYYITKTAYDYVQTHMYYTFDNGVRNKGALFAAHYNVGNCEDYSSLMVALLRANNIPARTVTGFKVKPSDLQNGEVNLITGGVYARHMWVEVYLPGYDWVAFDPVISSSTMQTYAVKDENGITYSSTPSVQAYRPLSSPVYSSFGKLPNLYIKERYDFGEGKNLASVTSSPASFNEYWFGQIVPYSSFTPITSIAIKERLEYAATPVTLSVEGIKSDNTKVVIPSNTISWSSTNPTVAAVDSTGAVSFSGKNGSVTITATYEEMSDSVSTTVNLAPSLTTIVINEPLAYSTPPVQLTATARYSDHSTQALSSGVTWESSNPTIATVDSSGKVTFTGKNGSVTITATYQGQSHSVSTTVNLAPTLSTITINESLAYSTSLVQLTATARYSDNSSQALSSGVTWESSNPTIATVDSSGKVTFTGKNGSITITATYQGMSDSVSTTVSLAPTLSAIAINESLAYSTSLVQLTATARYSDNSSQALSSGVTWESSDPAVATVDSSGIVSFTGKNGSITITATYQGMSDSVSTTVNLAPTLSAIAINESLAYSTSLVQLTATALYSDNSTLALSSGVTWESSDPAVATVDSSGIVSFTGKNGSVTITASYQGMSDSVSTTISLEPTLSAITINESLAYSTSPVPLTATALYSDNSTQTLSSGVAWESSDPAIATVNSNGRVSFTGTTGSVTITAVFQGKSNSVSTTVSLTPTLTDITINESLAYSRSPVPLTATALYSDNSTQTLSSGVAWESSDPAIATVNSNGRVSFTGTTGSVTITAVFQGKSNSVSTTVSLTPTLTDITINESLAYSTSPVQLTVSALYSDSSTQALSTGIIWHSNNPSVATVDSNGRVIFTGVNGSVTITASYDGFSKSVSTTVTREATLLAIAINELLAYSSSPFQLSVNGYYSDGSTRSLNGNSWLSSNPNVATVDSNGRVLFSGMDGSVTITVTYDSLSSSVTANVKRISERQLISIKIKEPLVFSKTPVKLTVIGHYSDNTTELLQNVSWSSTNETVAGINNKGEVIFTGNEGSVEIIASYNGFKDTVNTEVVLKVEKPTSLQIVTPLEYSEEPLRLKVYATYAPDRKVQVNEATWKTDNARIATVSSNGTVTFTGKGGKVTISANYLGLTDSVSTTVEENILESIFIRESLEYSERSVDLTVKGRYADGSSKLLDNVTWSSSNTKVAKVSQKGVVTFTGNTGKVTITAKYKGKTDTVRTTVSHSLSSNNNNRSNRDSTSTNITPPFANNIVDSAAVERNILMLAKNLASIPVTDFSDTASHWAKQEIRVAKALNLTKGNPNGTFKPDDAITREEFVALVSRAFKINPVNGNSFNDTQSSWAKGYITALVKKGILIGNEDGTFKPESNITRAEMVTIISRLINFEAIPNHGSKYFPDIQQHWAKETISKVSQTGLIKGTDNNLFAPEDNTTRAEAIVILLRTLRLNSNIDSALSSSL
ncbi:Ig-like domain-containing protein [Brevibacillus borstelensis]|uniref:Ig-like domain-containing protein n=2 Tax=Brevibacillus borstelensis TaxID=45462 RepID=UPI002E1B863C|nr:Ig-like domain-containing protein [Brevibacillus borstelensis]